MLSQTSSRLIDLIVRVSQQRSSVPSWLSSRVMASALHGSGSASAEVDLAEEFEMGIPILLALSPDSEVPMLLLQIKS